MTVKKMIDMLKKYDETDEVYVEMKIDGIEFACPLEKLHENGSNLYLHANFGRPAHYEIKERR